MEVEPVECTPRLYPKNDSIDSVLFPANGPLSKEVYELYGDEGTGKTQCLLHLLASYLLPDKWNGITLGGRDIGVIYMDNDYHFNVLRLTVIMEHRITRACALNSDNVSLTDEDLDTFIKQCLKNLHVIRCSSSSQMIITLHSLDLVLKNKRNISILMIDGIAAFYWIDRSNGADIIATQESNLIKACIAIEGLKDKYELVVFATKPAIFTRKAKDENDQHTERALDHCEYLCKQWQRIVNYRWIFSRNIGHRSFHIKSDPAKGGIKFNANFSIDETGLVFHQ